MVRDPDPVDLTIDEVIKRICSLNEGLRDFWSRAYGWAPRESASLLAQSRLDRAVSFSHCLVLWDHMPMASQIDGMLILGWTNLGALVEGSMKWFLSVYRSDYPESDAALWRKGKLLEPDVLTFGQLRLIFRRYVWTPEETKTWDPWLRIVQENRNGIHAYKDRKIDDYQNLAAGIRTYLLFLRDLSSRVPYPDDVWPPSESSL